MATEATESPGPARERTPDDLPDVVKEALAEREAAIARGEQVPQFDADGFEIVGEVSADG